MSVWLLGVLLIFLILLSAVESAITHLTRLSLKVMAEKHSAKLLEEIARDRRGVLLPLQFGIQLVLLSIIIVMTQLFLQWGIRQPLLWAFGAAVLVVVFLRQLVPRVFAVIWPREMLLKLLPAFNLIYRLLKALSLPIWGSIEIIDRRKLENTFEQEEDPSEEEILAYLGVGEEEGIIESRESQLLQSALEFRSTLVREIMTPRDEITAMEENATAGELKRLIVESKHSRIPIYRDLLDQIVGVVYVRNLLSYLEDKSEEAPITPIVAEPLVVPETKRVPILLEQMQSTAAQMAMVVNEYGTIAGLVTIEDLLEEIVGEIRDEDESDEADLIQESQGSFVVTGGAEIEDLEEVIGVEFAEHEAATVSGLIVDHLGRVPDTGEKLVLNGISIEVLAADPRKISTIRVRAEKRSLKNITDG